MEFVRQNRRQKPDQCQRRSFRPPRFLPVAADQALYTLSAGNPFRLLSPASALVALAGWMLVALAGAAAVLHRRDA